MPYKKHYSICIYERNKEETCVGYFDSAEELAEYLNTSLHSVYAMLYKRMKGEQKTIVVGRKLYNLEIVKTS